MYTGYLLDCIKVCMFIKIFIRLFTQCICVHLHVFCVYDSVHYACMYVCMYVCIYVSMYALYVYMCMCQWHYATRWLYITHDEYTSESLKLPVIIITEGI